jgi:predicted amidohydrolase YtcJ
LDKDPLTVSDPELLTIKVDMTIVAGRIVYTRERALD